jgi:RNA polymerase sigma factor (sigma-70 family)
MGTLPERINDQRFVTALFEQNGGQSFGCLLSRVWNRDDAADLLQEVWLKAITHAAELRTHPNPAAWLNTVATTTALDYLRKKKPSQFAEGTEGSVADPDPAPVEEEELFFTRKRLVEDCVSRLDEEGRAALRAKFEGSQQDLANRLGKTIDAIYKVSSRALASVRQCVAGKLGKGGLSA